MTFDLQGARDALAEASAGIDGADLPYHPHALQAMRTGEKLLAEVERLTEVVRHAEADAAAWRRQTARLVAAVAEARRLLDESYAAGRTWIPMAAIRAALDLAPRPEVRP